MTHGFNNRNMSSHRVVVTITVLANDRNENNTNNNKISMIHLLPSLPPSYPLSVSPSPLLSPPLPPFDPLPPFAPHPLSPPPPLSPPVVVGARFPRSARSRLPQARWARPRSAWRRNCSVSAAPRERRARRAARGRPRMVWRRTRARARRCAWRGACACSRRRTSLWAATSSRPSPSSPVSTRRGSSLLSAAPLPLSDEPFLCRASPLLLGYSSFYYDSFLPAS